MVLAVFVGFSRSYYLKELYGTPTLPTLFHVHGLLFTSWMVLLVVQTGLVATRRTPVHRRLGVAGGVLAFAMTVAAMAMTMDLARRSAGAPNDIGLAFTIVPFFTVIVFPVLVGIALLYRRQPEIHKRLMLIATLELVTAGVARIPGAGSMPLFFVLTDVGLVAILLYDVDHARAAARGYRMGWTVPDRHAVHPHDRRRHRDMDRVRALPGAVVRHNPFEDRVLSEDSLRRNPARSCIVRKY